MGASVCVAASEVEVVAMLEVDETCHREGLKREHIGLVRCRICVTVCVAGLKDV